MANISTFRILQEDSGDRAYPRENTKLRQKQANHARRLIARMRETETAADIIAAGKSEGSGRKYSPAAERTKVSGIISAADLVERHMNEQQVKADEGLTVTLLSGEARHLLSDVFVGLYFELKTHYAKVAAGDVDEEGETLIPDSGKVSDTDDLGPAIIASFLLRSA